MRAQRLLRWISRVIVTHPKRVLLGALALGLVCVFAVPGLRVEAGHSALIDGDNPDQLRFKRFLERFGSPYLAFAVVEGGTPQLRRQLLDGLERKLPQRAAVAPDKRRCPTESRQHNSPGCVRDVLARVDLDALSPYGLLYAPLPDLRRLVDALSDDDLGLPQLVPANTLAALLSAVATGLEARADQASAGGGGDQAERAMTLLAKVIDELEQRLREDQKQRPPIAQALKDQLAGSGGRRKRGGVDSSGYLASRDGDLHLAVIRPANESDDPQLIVAFVRYVQRIADELAAQIGDRCAGSEACPKGPPRVTLTGLPALTAAEKKGLGRDLPLTTALALGGIVALFIFGFRSVRQGLIALVPLALALVATLAFVRVAVGSLNMITTAFIPTVLGLGIDFSVHLLSRYNEARRFGLDTVDAIKTALGGAGPAMITGALTTAGAFCALLVSDFKGFSELGLITAVGLLVSLGATLMVTPAMLVLPSLRWLQVPPREPKLRRWPIVARLVARHHAIVLIAALTITGLMVWRASHIPWSYNYLDLLPKGTAAVDAMHTLAEKTDFSGEVGAVVAKGAQDARQKKAALLAKPTVGRVEALINYLPQGQDEKGEQLSRLQSLIEGLPQRPERVGNEPDVAALRDAAQQLKDTLQDLKFTAKQAGREEAAALQAPIVALERLRQTLTAADAQPIGRRLLVLERELFDALDQGIAFLERASRAGNLTEARLRELLPTGLRERLYADGEHALYVYPRGSIWKEGVFGRFVRDLRAVDAEATGFPVKYWEVNMAIERGFRRASVIAALALLGLLVLDFRNLRYALLALAPLALGMGWMWGAMSLLGMSYNFANIIAFPLIIGIGVASGVHILHRYRQEGERDIGPVVEHTGLAVVLSAATTMVGFGSLSLATHRGAASLGLVLLIGVGACLATSTLILPALLHGLRSRSKRDAT